MPATKKELADKLGVAKQTVVNYIERLGISEEHIKRVGKTDLLDDYAVSAIADAISKGTPPKQQEGAEASRDAVLDALNARISDLKEENARLVRQLEAEQIAHAREVEELRSQLAEANDRASRLADRIAGIAERQQAFAALPWWKRGALAVKLLGPGGEQ